LPSEFDPFTAHSREELRHHLENLADAVSRENGPWDEGEPIFEADETAIVENALEEYEFELFECFGPEA